VPYLTDPEDLGAFVPGEPPFRARQLREWLYRRPVLETAEMTNLPEPIRRFLADRLWPFAVEAEQTADRRRTVK
jgi:adenine C2-methylase RlmN of 23S rRNA A2503 and tRNA A37